MLIGVVQSLFEGAMYTFVFGWTPLLEETGAIPHGFVFASFMISCSIGATIFNYLSKNGRPEDFMVYVFSFAAVCMFLSTMAHSAGVQMLCFCGFEVTVGIFWPSIMSMRSSYLPEEGRATIMNIFRIPLNFIVCLILYNQVCLAVQRVSPHRPATLQQLPNPPPPSQEVLSVKDDFIICAGAHLLCALLVKYLSSIVPPKTHAPLHDGIENEPVLPMDESP